MISLTNHPCVCSVKISSSSPHIIRLPPPIRALNCNFKPPQIQSTIFRQSVTRIKAASDENEQKSPVVTVDVEEEDKAQSTPNKEVEESVSLLKEAAKTRKVAAAEIMSAFKVLEKAKLDPSGFCETLGGSESPGRTWMLIFTADKGLESGKYFPITAVQRFDAAAKRIENGVYFGALGCLTFEGRFSWKKRILAFMFELVRIKIGPLSPFEINIKGGGDDESEPSTKNPFFNWFYIDEEIAVARGKSGGTAFWCRCKRVV